MDVWKKAVASALVCLMLGTGVVRGAEADIGAVPAETQAACNTAMAPAVCDDRPVVAARALHPQSVVSVNHAMSKSDIVKMAQQYPTSALYETPRTTRFSTQPSYTAPYAEGALEEREKQQAVNTLKMVRYLAGLNYREVSLDKAYNKYSQKGTVLLAASGQFTHDPTKPVDMSAGFFKDAFKGCKEANISAGYNNLPATIMAQVADRGRINVSIAGHRRWILAPGAAEFGAGFAANTDGGDLYGGYRTSLYVFGRDDSVDNDSYIAWPNGGDFPLQYFLGNSNLYTKPDVPWSINLGAAYSVPDKNDITLELTRGSDGRVWLFNRDTPDLGGLDASGSAMHLSCDDGGYGMGKAIVFRPDMNSLGTIDKNETFTVKLSGLKDKGGSTAEPIEYTVSFFDLHQEISVEAEELTLDPDSLSIQQGDVSDISFQVYPDESLAGAMPTVASSNTGVATATVGDDSICVEGVAPGEATITVTVGSVSAECAVTVTAIPVSSISLSHSNISLQAGESQRLTVQVSPDNATDPSVTWDSSDEAVATVDSEGNVSAIAAGEATVTATSVDGGKTDSCVVQVSSDASSSEPSSSTSSSSDSGSGSTSESSGGSSSSTPNSSGSGSGSTSESSGGSPSSTPSSSGSGSGSTSESSGGSSSSTPNSSDSGSGSTSETPSGPSSSTPRPPKPGNSNPPPGTSGGQPPAPNPPATGGGSSQSGGSPGREHDVSTLRTVYFPQKTLYLVVGNSKKMPAQVYVAGSGTPAVTYSVRGGAAKVSKSGKITAVKKGSATITATASLNGHSVTTRLTVKVVGKNDATALKNLSVSGFKKSMKKGQMRYLKPKYFPAKATGVTPVWKSSNSKVAQIDKAGRLVAKKAGKTTITLKAGNITVKMELTVR